jgi:hypothetical protein
MKGKVCTTCQIWKEADCFHKDKGKKDGLKNYCRDCYKNKIYSYNSSGGTEKRKPYIKNNKEKRKPYVKKGYKPPKPHIVKNNIMGKECGQCNEWRPLTEYHKFSRMPDGLELYCKVCRKKMLSDYFQTDAGKENAYKASGKRRSRMKGVKFTAHFKKEVFKRDKYICQHCGIKVHNEKRNTPDKAHADHKISLFDGGDTVLDNMQTLCRTCNLSKGKKSEGEYQLTLF